MYVLLLSALLFEYIWHVNKKTSLTDKAWLFKVGHWSGNGFWWYLNNQSSNLSKTFRMWFWWEKMTNCKISSHLHNRNYGNRLFCENRYAWFCGRSCSKTMHMFLSFLFVMIHWSVVECNDAVFDQLLTIFIIKKKLQRLFSFFQIL